MIIRLVLYFSPLRTSEKQASKIYGKREKELPYPAIKTVAEMIGVDKRTIERYCSMLIKKGFLFRIRKGNKFYWNFRGLYDALNTLSNTDTSDDAVNAFESTISDNYAIEHRQNCSGTPADLLSDTDTSDGQRIPMKNSMKKIIKNKDLEEKDLLNILDSLSLSDKSLVDYWTNHRVGFGCTASRSRIEELRMVELSELVEDGSILYNETTGKYEVTKY